MAAIETVWGLPDTLFSVVMVILYRYSYRYSLTGAFKERNQVYQYLCYHETNGSLVMNILLGKGVDTKDEFRLL